MMGLNLEIAGEGTAHDFPRSKITEAICGAICYKLSATSQVAKRVRGITSDASVSASERHRWRW
jgi:hypothetical protein